MVRRNMHTNRGPTHGQMKLPKAVERAAEPGIRVAINVTGKESTQLID